jgi:hypothetical protein
MKNHKPLLLGIYKFRLIFLVAPLHEVFKILLYFVWQFFHEVLYARRFMVARLAGGGLLLMCLCFFMCESGGNYKIIVCLVVI